MSGNVAVFVEAILLAAALALPANAASLLPGMLYELDPGLPASTAALGTTPDIQLNKDNGIVAMRLAGSGEVLRRGMGQSRLARVGLDGRAIIVNPAGASPGGWGSLVFNPAAADMPAYARDLETNFLDTPSNPPNRPLPIVAGATPGDGLRMSPGSRNAFSLVMGSGQAGANMVSAQSIRDVFFLNYMSGNLKETFGSPVDTGQANNNTFAAVARHYRPGDPNDLHVMAADGMHLRAVCSRAHADCRPGHVWGAMVRLPFEWRPGTTLKVRYRSPKGDHAWTPIWFFTGQQVSPGPTGDPYQGFGGPNALYRPGPDNTNFEIDWNDNFSRVGNGVLTGYQIDFGTPDIYGTKWKTKPHGLYWANGNGWRYYDQSYGPEFEQTPFDWSAGFHNLVGNWRGDGSNLIDVIVDGKLVATSYMEYPQKTYVDPANGQRKTVAMHLLIGNQAIPGFSRGATTARDNDGIPDGWTIVVQEISGWYGNVADPDSTRASPINGVR